MHEVEKYCVIFVVLLYCGCSATHLYRSDGEEYKSCATRYCESKYYCCYVSSMSQYLCCLSVCSSDMRGSSCQAPTDKPTSSTDTEVKFWTGLIFGLLGLVICVGLIYFFYCKRQTCTRSRIFPSNFLKKDDQGINEPKRPIVSSNPDYSSTSQSLIPTSNATNDNAKADRIV